MTAPGDVEWTHGGETGEEHLGAAQGLFCIAHVTLVAPVKGKTQ